jgi:hypothetical protein
LAVEIFPQKRMERDPTPAPPQPGYALRLGGRKLNFHYRCARPTEEPN